MATDDFEGQSQRRKAVLSLVIDIIKLNRSRASGWYLKLAYTKELWVVRFKLWWPWVALVGLLGMGPWR